MRAFILAATIALALAPAAFAQSRLSPQTLAAGPFSPPPAALHHRSAVRGNVLSHIYEWPGCPAYSRIRADHRVEFASADAAEKAGYRAARNCHWRARE